MIKNGGNCVGKRDYSGLNLKNDDGGTVFFVYDVEGTIFEVTFAPEVGGSFYMTLFCDEVKLYEEKSIKATSLPGGFAVS